MAEQSVMDKLLGIVVDKGSQAADAYLTKQWGVRPTGDAHEMITTPGAVQPAQLVGMPSDTSQLPNTVGQPTPATVVSFPKEVYIFGGLGLLALVGLAVWKM